MKLHLLLPDGTQRTFTTDDGSAIAVELTAKDRENIAGMMPDATLYAMFDDERCEPARVLAWLQAVKP